MRCSATKRNGLPCTFQAKVNGRCGFNKLKPIPKPRGIPLQWLVRPFPKPRVKKTALDEQLKGLFLNRARSSGLFLSSLKQPPILQPRKKKLGQHTPADRLSKRNKFLREC